MADTTNSQNQTTQTSISTSPSLSEVSALEHAMIAAELGPDPDYYRTYLDDNVILDFGEFGKSMVVKAHEKNPDTPFQKFTSVNMSNYVYHDHGTSVVVVCEGEYTTTTGKTFKMKFQRVWHKDTTNNKWKIISANNKML